MKIYLVRHGETQWNKQMIIQGITDNPLNDTGVAQALTIKQFFENKPLDLVISSSLMRARQTANIALDYDPDIVDDRFIERNFGEFEGKDISEFYQARELDQDLDIEADESLRERVMRGLSEYQDFDYNTIAIFAHSHVLKAALSAIDPDNYNFQTTIKNCAILELSYDKEFKIVDIH